jgi:hypothetical protein
MARQLDGVTNQFPRTLVTAVTKWTHPTNDHRSCRRNIDGLLVGIAAWLSSPMGHLQTSAAKGDRAAKADVAAAVDHAAKTELAAGL